MTCAEKIMNNAQIQADSIFVTLSPSSIFCKRGTKSRGRAPNNCTFDEKSAKL